jgi:hypothetical protein
MAKTKNDVVAPKHFEDQYDDETVDYVFRRHPIVMRKGLVFGMLGPLFGIIPAAVAPSLGFAFFFGGLAVGCILGLIIFGISWMPWYFSVFIVTDQREGVLSSGCHRHYLVADPAYQLRNSGHRADTARFWYNSYTNLRRRFGHSRYPSSRQDSAQIAADTPGRGHCHGGSDGGE